MKFRSGYLALILVLGLAAVALVQSYYDSHHNYFALRHTFVSLPSGKSIRILSCGYDSLMADMLHIWAIQFYSTNTLKNRFDFIEKIFGTITDLAPRYRDPYFTGTLIMENEKNDYAMTLRLFDKAIQNMPQDWNFYNLAGYTAWKGLHDYERAKAYYAKAAALPDAPEFIKRHEAHMIYLENDLRMAWQMWMEIYQSSRSTPEKISAFNHLFQIKGEQDIALLTKTVAEFKTRFGRSPRSLEELAARGLIAQVPLDFSGKTYLYDPPSGSVKPRREFRWKRYR